MVLICLIVRCVTHLNNHFHRKHKFSVIAWNIRMYLRSDLPKGQKQTTTLSTMRNRRKHVEEEHFNVYEIFPFKSKKFKRKISTWCTSTYFFWNKRSNNTPAENKKKIRTFIQTAAQLRKMHRKKRQGAKMSQSASRVQCNWYSEFRSTAADLFHFNHRSFKCFSWSSPWPKPIQLIASLRGSAISFVVYWVCE